MEEGLIFGSEVMAKVLSILQHLGSKRDHVDNFPVISHLDFPSCFPGRGHARVKVPQARPVDGSYHVT
eukprot:844582-Amorphochlora_amoeboformis.AAC.1